MRQIPGEQTEPITTDYQNFNRLQQAIEHYIVGQKTIINQLLIALLSGGHVILGHWYRLARSYKRCNTRGSTNQANLE